jgi:hypothetical protein
MERFPPKKFFLSKEEKRTENEEVKRKKLKVKKEEVKRIKLKVERKSEFKVPQETKAEIKEELEKCAEKIISKYFRRERESGEWEEFLPVHEKNEKHRDEIGRIKMEAFSSIYPEAQRELQEEFIHLQKWQRQKEGKEYLKKKRK